MSDQVKLSITVTAQQAQAIRDRVASGAYASTSEVIRAGLRSLESHEDEHRQRIERLRGEINKGFDDPRPRLPLDEAFDEVRNRIAETETTPRAKAAG